MSVLGLVRVRLRFLGIGRTPRRPHCIVVSPEFGPLRVAVGMRGLRRALLASSVLVATGLASPAAAQNATWLAVPANNGFEIAVNWDTGNVPTGTASFGASNTTSIGINVPVTLGGFTLNALAPAYYFGNGGDLVFNGNGIINNSVNILTLENFAFSSVDFRGTSTAGNAAIINNNLVLFSNTSTAGSATITNTGGLSFQNASTAGNAIITNNLGVVFSDTSTAGSATITNNNAMNFFNTSTAGSATITNNQIMNFFNTSTAGGATLITNLGATTDFSGATGPANNFRLSAGSIAGAGSYLLGFNELTVGGNNLSTVVSGVISGGGLSSLVKTGTGTLTLSGTNTYTGATTVNAGGLIVNGEIASGQLAVNSGGTLSGTGTVGNTQIGGTFSPGSGTAGTSMTVSGSLAFQSGAIYMVQINSASAAANANVSATATLTGASVNVTAAAGVYTTGQSYTILTATGGLGGTTFSGLNITGSIRGHLSYDANNVFFIVDPSTLTLPAGLSGNQLTAAGAINNYVTNGGTLPPGFLSVLNLTGPALANALTQFTGEIGAGAQRTSFIAMTQLIGVLLDPFNRSDDASTAGSGVTSYASEGDASAYAADGRKRSDSERSAYAMMTKAPPKSFEVRWNVWAAGYGGSQTTDGNAALGSNSTTSRIYGTAVGADYLISPNTMAGFALAGGGTNFSIANSGTGRSDLFQAAGFFRHKIGAAYLAGALAYGWQDTTTNRTVTVAGIDQLQAKFRSNAFSGRLEGGYRFVAPMAFGITPYAAGQFTTFNLPAYAEQALVGTNTFALAYGAKSITSPRSELGVRTDKSYALPDATILTLRGRLAWAHDYNPNASVAANFQTLPGASFVTNGASTASDAALVTASAEMKWRNGFSLAGTFEGEFSNVTLSYAGKGVARYQW